jgi:hypothetical protein
MFKTQVGIQEILLERMKDELDKIMTNEDQASMAQFMFYTARGLIQDQQSPFMCWAIKESAVRLLQVNKQRSAVETLEFAEKLRKSITYALNPNYLKVNVSTLELYFYIHEKNISTDTGTKIRIELLKALGDYSLDRMVEFMQEPVQKTNPIKDFFSRFLKKISLKSSLN